MLHKICLSLIIIICLACSENKKVSDVPKDTSSLQPVNATPIISLMTKPDGVSFDVNDVPIAPSLLKVYQAKEVFESKVGKKILFFPEEHKPLSLVTTPNNAFIQTIQECYDEHRPLVLSPDIIWLAISQGVAMHINQHYSELKNRIFIKNKPEELIIRNDSLEYASKHWKQLISDLSEQTKPYTKQDYYHFFVGDYSTTGPIEQTVYKATLLHGYKKTFQYVAETGCGIPSILIRGNKEDWQKIMNRLDKLDNIGLKEWKIVLQPIIKEFILAVDGKANRPFWQQIYKTASEYGGSYISGWIIKFFPYIKKLEIVQEEQTLDSMIVNERYEWNPFLEDDMYLRCNLMTDNFPSGILDVPITWVNYNTKVTLKIEVYAGFMGIKQYNDKSLEPLISWAVCKANAPKVNPIEYKHKSLKISHIFNFWSPNIVDEVTKPAIYNSKKFKTQAQSLNYLKRVLLDSLQQHKKFIPTEYVGDTLEIEVLLNGKLGKVTLQKSSNKQLQAYLQQLLKQLPAPWLPALANQGSVLEMMDESDDTNKKVRVNSVVKLPIMN